MPSDGACSGFFELFGFIAAVAVGEVEPKEGKTSSRQKSQSSTIREFDPDEHDKKCPDCAEYIKLEARAAVRCCREAGGFIISLSGSNSSSSALPKPSPFLSDHWEPCILMLLRCLQLVANHCLRVSYRASIHVLHTKYPYSYFSFSFLFSLLFPLFYFCTLRRTTLRILHNLPHLTNRP